MTFESVDGQSTWTPGKPAAKVNVMSITPKKGNAIDRPSLWNHMDQLSAQGIHYMTFLTMVGEYSAIHLGEKQAVIEAVYHTRRRDRWDEYMVNVTDHSIESTLLLGNQALRAGASNILVNPFDFVVKDPQQKGAYRHILYHEEFEPFLKKMKNSLGIWIYVNRHVGAQRLVPPDWIEEWTRNYPNIKGIVAQTDNMQYLTDLQQYTEGRINQGDPFEMYITEGVAPHVITIDDIPKGIGGVATATANVIPRRFLHWVQHPEQARWLRIEEYKKGLVDRVRSLFTTAVSATGSGIQRNPGRLYVQALKERLQQKKIIEDDELF